MEEVGRRCGIEVEVFFTNAGHVGAMGRSEGLNLFYESTENRISCCHVRKVEPLGRALATLDGWITGLRRDQIVTRVATDKIAPDPGHQGVWKVAPLAYWKREREWAYFRVHDPPYNAPIDRDYTSIDRTHCQL